MPQIGPAEILVIVLVGLLVFGPHRLPEIGRQVGKGMRELRKFQDTVRGELDEVLNFSEPAGPPPLAEAPPVAGDGPGASADAGVGTAAPASSAAAAAAPTPARAPSRFRAPGTPPGA
jgi:Tat protein translocase TatB subunit